MLTSFKDYINSLNVNVIDVNEGHTATKGSNAGLSNINEYAVVYEDDLGYEYIIMKIDDNTYTKLSTESIESVKGTNNTWFLTTNNYIGTSINGKKIYLHQFILNHYGNNKGQSYIEHINNNVFDNRLENLRIIKKSDDEPKIRYLTSNPPPILHNIKIPKHVKYYSEFKDKNKQVFVEYFRINKTHPAVKLMNKTYIPSSKDLNKSLIEKFVEIRIKLKRLDEYLIKYNENPNKEIIINNICQKSLKFPVKYITISEKKDKIILLYYRRINGVIETLQVTYSKNDDIKTNILNFKNEVYKKFKYDFAIPENLNDYIKLNDVNDDTNEVINTKEINHTVEVNNNEEVKIINETDNTLDIHKSLIDNCNIDNIYSHEDVKKYKISLSNSKKFNKLSDDMINEIREHIKNGKKNVEIVNIYKNNPDFNITRDVVSNIKRNKLVPKNEKTIEQFINKKEKKSLNMSAITRRKFTPKEILKILELYNNNYKYNDIITELNNSNITYDSVKNVCNFKTKIYPEEELYDEYIKYVNKIYLK